MNLKVLLQLACVAVILFQAIVTYQPGPGPNPVDPVDPIVDPVDPVNPAPFQTDRLTVLIVRETETSSDLPQSQIGIFNSIPVRNACAGNIRILDNETPILEDGPWQAAMNAVKASGVSLPAIAISNGRTGTIEPLPLTSTATVTLIGAFD